MAQRPDGSWTKGYRKTDRRIENRREPEEMPDWRMTFRLPSHIAFAVSPGVACMSGVIAKEDGRVEIVGRNRDWVVEQAAKFLAGIAAKQEFTVSGTLWRSDEPSPSLTGASRRGFRVSHEFAIVQGPCVVVAMPNDKPQIFPAAV